MYFLESIRLMAENLLSKRDKPTFSHDGCLLYTFLINTANVTRRCCFRDANKNECEGRVHTKNNGVVKNVNEHCTRWLRHCFQIHYQYLQAQAEVSSIKSFSSLLYSITNPPETSLKLPPMLLIWICFYPGQQTQVRINLKVEWSNLTII